MRDPIEELKNLSTSGSVPLPPSEVRHRGDRMRRRRIAFQAVGAAAAVLAIVSGGAFASGELTDTAPDPGPAKHHTVPKPSEDAAPEGGWRTSIPQDFVLTDGLPEPADETARRLSNRSRPWQLDPCGEGKRGSDADRTDQRVLTQVGGELYHRQLALYPDDDAARAVVADLRDDLARCRTSELGDAVLVWEHYGDPFTAGDESFDTVSRPMQEGEAMLFADHYAVVRVGNAVLLTLDSGSYGHESPERITQLIQQPRAAAAAVAARMCIFAVDPCAQAMPEEPEPSDVAVPERPTYMLSAEDLVNTTGIKDWQVTEEDWGPALVCSKDSTEALGGDRTTTLQYTVTRGGQTVAWATATVLDFASREWADGAYTMAADWLTTCDASVDRRHRISSAGEAYGEPHTGGPDGRPWVWRTVMSSRPELCVECDAAWNNHQAVVSAGRRLVLVQVSVPGDMQSSADESSSPFPVLAELAAKRAWAE